MSFRLRALALTIFFLCVVQSAWGQTPSAPQSAELGEPNSAARGQNLFLGVKRFQNGGPACGECHKVAGLSFPGGGTLGPDLTHEYTKLGPEGIDAALQTLFFPAMAPIYDKHPLTAQERADLTAFFQRADATTTSSNNTPIVLLIAVIGFVILIVIMGLVWRNRLKGVRRNLLENGARPITKSPVSPVTGPSASSSRVERDSEEHDSDQGGLR